jgi:hypothetical protein
MTTTESIPVTVTSEASAFIQQLGLDAEFDRMIEHTRQAVPNLRRIEVTYEFDLSDEMHSSVVIWSHRDRHQAGDDPTNRGWSRWLVETFPPAVCQHFVMICT